MQDLKTGITQYFNSDLKYLNSNFEYFDSNTTIIYNNLVNILHKFIQNSNNQIKILVLDIAKYHTEFYKTHLFSSFLPYFIISKADSQDALGIFINHPRNPRHAPLIRTEVLNILDYTLVETWVINVVAEHIDICSILDRDHDAS